MTDTTLGLVSPKYTIKALTNATFNTIDKKLIFYPEVISLFCFFLNPFYALNLRFERKELTLKTDVSAHASQ